MSFQIIAERPILLPFTIELSSVTEENALTEGFAILSDADYPFTSPLEMWNVASGEVFPVAVSEKVSVVPPHTSTSNGDYFSLQRYVETDNTIYLNNISYTIPTSSSIGSNEYIFFGRLEEGVDEADGTYSISDMGTKKSRFFKLPVDAASITNALSQVEVMRTNISAMTYYRPHLVIDVDSKTVSRIGRANGNLFLSTKPVTNLLGYLTPPSDIDNYY
jgi:hypothetical protein